MAGASMISPSARQYLLVLAGSLGLFLLLATLTATTYLHNVRVDLSPGDRYTLSDHTLAALRGLDEPVKITGFIRTQDPRNPLLKDLLWQAANESPYIEYSIVDVNKNPAMAAEYGVDAYGSTVVESAKRRSDFANPSEAQLVSALLYATRPPKKVYMLAGHGECGMNDADRHSGCSLLRDALRVEFYRVEELSLRGERGVPEDCDVLLIAGPAKDPTRSELDALADYLEAGGKLLVMIDPFSAQRLAAWLRGWGIDMADDIVVDPQNRLGGGEPLSAVATDVNRQQLILQRLEAPPLFSGVRSLKAKDDEEQGRVGVWLLRSGEQSWATSDQSILRGTAPRFVAGRDINGPLTLAAEVSMPASAAEKGGGVKTRIVAFGDSDFVSNRFLDYLGNRDLVLNTVNWLAREERMIAPRVPSREPGKEYFYPTQQDLERIFFTAALAQPGLFLLIGIVVLIWRRRKA
ncbi:MAG: GldG family protein [Candidatus Binatia bacterium]